MPNRDPLFFSTPQKATSFFSRFHAAKMALVVLFAAISIPSTSYAGQYLITIVSAQIAPKKSRFRRWDTGFGRMPLPDVYVIMEVSGQRFTTPIIDNTINPVWNISWKLTLNGDERLYFIVYDKDIGKNDLIGKGSVELDKANTPFGFDKVISLKIKVERLDPPPPPVRRVVKRPLPVRTVPAVIPPRPQPAIRAVVTRTPSRVVPPTVTRVAPRPAVRTAVVVPKTPTSRPTPASKPTAKPAAKATSKPTR